MWSRIFLLYGRLILRTPDFDLRCYGHILALPALFDFEVTTFEGIQLWYRKECSSSSQLVPLP